MIVMVNDPKPEIIQTEDTKVIKILRLVPKFKKIPKFLKRFSFFWKIETPIFKMKVTGNVIEPKINKGIPEIIGPKPPYIVQSGWINCLYNFSGTNFDGINLFDNIIGIECGTNLFIVQGYMPKKTKFFVSKKAYNNFLHVATKKIVLEKILFVPEPIKDKTNIIKKLLKL